MADTIRTDDVLLRLSAEETQKALAIGIDEDAAEALSFLKEKLAHLIKEELHSS